MKSKLLRSYKSISPKRLGIMLAVLAVLGLLGVPVVARVLDTFTQTRFAVTGGGGASSTGGGFSAGGSIGQPVAGAASGGGFTATNGFLNLPPCGLSWHTATSPNAGSSDNGLASVAAISSNDIWAVGQYTDTGRFKTLAEHWDGSSWITITSPITGTYNNILDRVAAVSANDVWAVGYYVYDNSSSSRQTLVEHWDGSTWSVIPSPNIGGTNELHGVAAAANDVWAVGDCPSCGSTLVEHWNGTVWSVVPSPNVGTYTNTFNGVEAVSANDVWAVGQYEDSGAQYQTLVEHWNGTVWSVVPSPNANTYINILNGVEAVSANDVWAVGYHLDNSGTYYQTLVEHWNGTSWSAVSSPNVGASYNNYLHAVAVVSANDVWAVGSYYNGTGGMGADQTLTEHWNGSVWSTVPSPNLSSSNNILFDVAAVSAGDVWAVGRYTNSGSTDQTLVLHYNDTCITPISTPTSTPTPVTIAYTNTEVIPFPSPPPPSGTPVPVVITSTINIVHGLQPSYVYSITQIEVSDITVVYTSPNLLDASLIGPPITPTGSITVPLFGNICQGDSWTELNTGFILDSLATGRPVIGDTGTCPPGRQIYRPQGDLRDFIGQSDAGLWTLRIAVGPATGKGGGIGGLHAWGLNITTHCVDCPTPTPTVTPIGTVVASSYSSDDVPKAIPPTSTVTSTLTVSQLRPDSLPSIYSLDVTNLHLGHAAHPDPSGLTISLVSPSGTQVPLFSNMCPNVPLTDTNTGFTLSDSASAYIGSVCPPNQGTYHPAGNLSVLAGQPSMGTWRLSVTNSVTDTTATLDSWGLQMTSQCSICATPTPTSTPAGIINGHLTWQGIAQPSANNNGLTATLTLCNGSSQAYSGQFNTINTGNIVFTTGLPDGTYNWKLKGVLNLGNSGALTISGGQATVEFGTLRAGDSNNSNNVNTTDFNIVKISFGKAPGQPGYDERANFNRDGAVNATDFNLLKNNFGQAGASQTCP